MVDDFSKFAILALLPRLDSTAVAEAFLERVLAVYGRPQRVRVDGGVEFKGKFTALMEALGVERLQTSPHSPWTNGIVERMVRFVKSLVRKTLIGVDKSMWPLTLPWI